MDFSKLKLVTEMYTQQPGMGPGSLAGTKLTQAANNKASQAAQAPKQTTVTANNLGMQAKQQSQKTGNIQSPNVQKPGGAPAKAATTGNMAVEGYFSALRARKEFVKSLDEATSDWKKELQEALGADDEVFHPYVEVMPFKNFKQNEAKANLTKQAMKQGAAENPAQKKVKKDAITTALGEERQDERGMSPDQKAIGRSIAQGENPLSNPAAIGQRQFRHAAMRGKKKPVAHSNRKETRMPGKQLKDMQERAFVQPQGTERKKAEKEDKKRQAQAAKDAARHARITKGIPGYDAKGKYYLKNGKKEYVTENEALRKITGAGIPDAPSFQDLTSQQRSKSPATKKHGYHQSTPMPKVKSPGKPPII